MSRLPWKSIAELALKRVDELEAREVLWREAISLIEVLDYADFERIVELRCQLDAKL